MINSEIASIELDISWTPQIKGNTAWGSVFHGMLMESLLPEQAAWLHEFSRRPYSQYLYCSRCEGNNEQWHWRINGLTAEAVRSVVKTAYELPNTLYSKQKQLSFEIVDRRIIAQTSYRELADQFLGGAVIYNGGQLQFKTSTGFKTEGKYALYPELKLILANILRRWNTYSTAEQLDDTHILETLLSNTYISNYRLAMRNFSLEKTRIPAFSGSVTIGCKNSLMIRRVIGMLLQYASFSGIGIKTALGMGGTYVNLRQEV